MAQQFQRPNDAFRFHLGGLKTNVSPDALPPDKYAIVQNVRGTSDNNIKTRPGQALRFATGGQPILNLRTYAAIKTQDQPRTLAVDALGAVWLDIGVQVATLATGPTAIGGASMLPFRPNESPNPYMYIANGADYQKVSAPGFGGLANFVDVEPVGIPEPQIPSEAVALPPIANVASIAQGSWTLGGTASALTSSYRTLDFVHTGVIADPNGYQYTIPIQTTSLYDRGMVIQIGAAGNKFWVEDVYSSLPTPIAIVAVAYYAGSSGRCVLVTPNLSAGKSGESLYSPETLASLRRGALIQFQSTGEIVYVLSVTAGPDGSIAIETSTANTYLAGATFTILGAIQVEQIAGAVAPTGGAVISETEISYSVAAGIGTATAPLTGLFTIAGRSFRPDDYISFAVLVNDPTNLIEAKILFDVSDGNYDSDYYYYTIRPSDLTGAVANTVTQLSIIQTIEQRAIIDAESAASADGQTVAAPSQQMNVGNSAWTQLFIPISALTRVGSAEALTLQNLVSVRFQWNIIGPAAGAIEHDFTIAVLGGSLPDVGNAGAPYMYRIRPRSSVTGAKGNASPIPRYGISPRRQSVNVSVPGTTTVAGFDTWDIFRYGGSVTEWRFIGSHRLTISNTIFVDNYDDAAARAGDALETDNFEPWPSIDVPFVFNTSIAIAVTGTTALVAVPASAQANVTRFLPGNLVRIDNQNVYTLWTRPTEVAGQPGVYLFQFVENAGFSQNSFLSIYEPAIAKQFLPYVWGPDANGTIFACGDPLRPGTLYFSKNFAPDAAPDKYNLEICQPSEPLLGGEIVDGRSFVGSSDRWWGLIPQPDNPSQRYAIQDQPIDRGLAAPLGHCNDGKQVYFWAKDGIVGSSTGSLTSADLSNLFPHEGVLGETIVRGPVTIYPPAYSQAASFRLAYSNGYLYATYIDIFATYRMLVLDTRTGAWSIDNYTPAVTSVVRVDQVPSNLTPSNPQLYDEILMGNVSGQVAGQQDLANDIGGPIACAVYTREFDAGDLRVGDQWGDMFFDAIPAAASASLTITPMSLGVAVAPAQIITQSFTRKQQPISLGGALYAVYMGLLFTWTDDFTRQATATRLHTWQPSFITQPEIIADRFTDWDDAGYTGAKWFQGFIMVADTFNAIKGLLVRDSDGLTAHPFSTAVQHNGESERAYSFDPPFIAHQVRIEPTDLLLWKLFGVKWLYEETPEVAETWQTQPSTHGLRGYMHIRQTSITYAAVAPVTFTITAYDGVSPAPITLPSTGGGVVKIVFPVTANKGQLYAYRMSSALPFQCYADKSEVLVGAWGREDAYMNKPLIGDAGGDEARI
jgi:hypothetical protein